VGQFSVGVNKHLTNGLQDFPVTLKQAMTGFVDAHLPSDAAGQAARICNRFAIIAIAGEYATGAGITGWKQGDAVTAAGTCFKSWLDSRGGGGNQERKAILSSVKAFFESHGESRFADITNDTNRVTINRAGFRKFTSEGQEYYVLPEAYNRDVCAGFDSKAVTKVLIEAGWLAPDEAGKSQQRKTLPEMGTTRCYVLTSKVWGD
jgi:putative DNA primase/helicase